MDDPARDSGSEREGKPEIDSDHCRRLYWLPLPLRLTVSLYRLDEGVVDRVRSKSRARDGDSKKRDWLDLTLVGESCNCDCRRGSPGAFTLGEGVN
jgi:hypothetical protein